MTRRMNRGGNRIPIPAQIGTGTGTGDGNHVWLQERWVRPVILAATEERGYDGHVFTGGYEQWVNGHNYPKDGCLHRGANGKCLPDWM